MIFVATQRLYGIVLTYVFTFTALKFNVLPIK